MNFSQTLREVSTKRLQALADAQKREESARSNPWNLTPEMKINLELVMCQSLTNTDPRIRMFSRFS